MLLVCFFNYEHNPGQAGECVFGSNWLSSYLPSGRWQSDQAFAEQMDNIILSHLKGKIRPTGSPIVRRTRYRNLFVHFWALSGLADSDTRCTQTCKHSIQYVHMLPDRLLVVYLILQGNSFKQSCIAQYLQHIFIHHLFYILPFKSFGVDKNTVITVIFWYFITYIFTYFHIFTLLEFSYPEPWSRVWWR